MWLTEIRSLFLFAYLVGLGFLSNYFLHRIDTKALLKSQEENYPGSFIAERAYQHLKVLNDLGPKVVGSIANEILAANYIHNQVNEIRSTASNPTDIIIERQLSSGFSFKYLNYVNLQNIVVRVQGETDNALMLNCHYDSVPGSPGASDDSVNCCTMLEIFRVLVKSKTKQKHTVIFLFNGSEETALQGAHGFITKQKWRKDVKAYINLESTGSGGREILFRTGPKHDWLVKMYRESVPRPFGHAVSEELFETGVIPSATDFQIFRDYGDIPGLDFAYVEDGWRYHTRYDSIDYISMESVQHTGNNILALTKKIANSKELADPPEGTSAIYFEYLGLFFVSYSATAGAVTNYIVSVLAFLVPFILQTKFKWENLTFVLFETTISLVTIIVSIALSAIACWGMAEIMNALDNTMSWFNTTFISIGIYGSLALIVQIGTYHIIQAFNSRLCMRSKKYREVSIRHRVKIYLNGVTLFWSILTILITAMGFKFGYLLMILLFVSLCTYLLTYFVCRLLSKSWSQTWILVHTIGHSVVFLFLCYLCLQIHQLFIPIAAKQFNENPDVQVALICVLWVTLCLSYFIPLTMLVRFRAALYSLLTIIFITYTILAFTSIGFPYSAAKSDPRVQRFETVHIKRTLYDSAGQVKRSANDITIETIDRNGIRTVKEAFGEYKLDMKHEFCTEIFLNCESTDGLGTVSIVNVTAEPNIAPTKFNLVKSTKNGDSIYIEFTLELRTLTSFSLTLDDGLSDVGSNVGYQARTINGTKHLTGYITFGAKSSEPYQVDFILKGTPSSDVLARLTVETQDSTFDQGKITPEFSKVLSTFPDYTFTYVHQVDSSTYEIKAF